jgi:hypothetical protein
MRVSENYLETQIFSTPYIGATQHIINLVKDPGRIQKSRIQKFKCWTDEIRGLFGFWYRLADFWVTEISFFFR